ncbi:uncharacterized protein LOC129217188 [Uloborus diversus]|uniref:uncharacterized protein LOC129217188 n=1 Tax=Uloborus diversus TaxID=327109 RepID=UPI00240A3AF9|nr:uncharacterized protein LOC129217188 [Uloborus diversus]
MTLKFSLWTFLTTSLCLVAPSLGELQPHSLSSGSTVAGDLLDQEKARLISLAESLGATSRVLRMLAPPALNPKKKRKFPEVDSRGFDEDIFDEGFGDWSPMKRW